MCRLNFVILNDILCGYFVQSGAESEGAPDWLYKLPFSTPTPLCGSALKKIRVNILKEF